MKRFKIIGNLNGLVVLEHKMFGVVIVDAPFFYKRKGAV